LHIGKSHDLFQRLKSFRKGAILRKFPAHFASGEFFKWGFEAVIAKEDLCFDFVPSENEEAARKHETELHRSYRRNFLDRPPLDGTSGEQLRIGKGSF
jgi:hypothetical protein